ncbi:acyl-CoA N-acyltransferase [Lentinula edodes]|uniref:Acyl-CoA N-acyltransferase n=1 Tax=Lentinula lateritia TaxID=40482 RepID=A0A9W9DSH3_9AGAR|nr:acyl-CoA N-acyltransferase [Lentinula edodes]KAH7871130.1 acyl-CoA N-acyltransferase [Lentinula edodes]KAJ3892682.1 acyl-CoA N-acyltransferase [Lentinula edodes]KAJ3906745.1 acyl-CoA N-acyltransferase [Lentinula edodes]KAJ3915502.1 acyl-CoA N-acyltransferase [Lentinula edodes]KAJ4484198.1 acyl-CoA N-acyltransferase [Lentinula edodes]
MNIRLARAEDVVDMQQANLVNLPENYHIRLWIYHIVTWPQLSYVAEDRKGRIVGYVLAKIDEESEDKSADVHGHINSISVMRSYRRLGLAKKLMLLSQEAMASVYKAKYVSLHVRETNQAAIGLYRDTLGFEVANTEKGYYADGENAYMMRLDFKNKF